MKFWENHAKEMRKARLLQAAAMVYTVPGVPNACAAVRKAFELEGIIQQELEWRENGTPESVIRS